MPLLDDDEEELVGDPVFWPSTLAADNEAPERAFLFFVLGVFLRINVWICPGLEALDEVDDELHAGEKPDEIGGGGSDG